MDEVQDYFDDPVLETFGCDEAGFNRLKKGERYIKNTRTGQYDWLYGTTNAGYLLHHHLMTDGLMVAFLWFVRHSGRT